MKRAADCGHSKAQFEHGLGLFSVRDISIFIMLGKILMMGPYNLNLDD